MTERDRLPEAIGLDESQRERLHAACRALGTSYVEFVRHATLQAVDEVLGP
jgi:hypothetical protein